MSSGKHTPDTKESPCVPWSGAIDSEGYGRVQAGGKSRRAHRIAYEAEIGPIPKGLELDHICRNRSCVNTSHLEPVTTRENVLRGVGPTANNARKTHCAAGHPLAGSNLRLRPSGRRECKECARRRWREYRRRRIAQGAWRCSEHASAAAKEVQ